MQREIQLAVSSDQRGKAGAAARHIKVCETVERLRTQIEAGGHRRPEAEGGALLAHLQQDLTSCQAVDAASREQLVPLLRRSLAEGDKGAAAALVPELGKGFDPASEPDIVAALRRDAGVCDLPSIFRLGMLARQHPQLLTPNEVGALREKERTWAVASADAMRRMGGADPKRKAALDSLMESLKPPPDADPAEVVRLAAEMQRHCPVKLTP